MKQVISPRKILLKVYTRFEEQRIVASVSVVGETNVALGASVELQLVNAVSGKVLQRQKRKILFSTERTDFSFRLPRTFPSGTYKFRAFFTDKNGIECTTQILQDKSPGKFSWLGNGEGISRKVPKPWIPLKTKSNSAGFSVECWGRKYEFGRRDFLNRISSAGKSLLARPVRLLAKVNGRKIIWQKGTLQRIADEPDQCALFQQISADGLSITSHIEVDFDGMIRIDWRLSSQKAVRIDALTMEIPIPAVYAKYLYYFPGKWSEKVKNANAMPLRGMNMRFHPFVWLGDEERGFAWFTESDENWFTGNPDKAIEIKREGDVVVLRLHLVSSTVNLKPHKANDFSSTSFGEFEASSSQSPTVKYLRYTFGFQATPVKPVKIDAWDHRTFCILIEHPGVRGGVNISTAYLDKLAKAGIRTVVIFEYWSDAEGHVVATYRRQLKKVVKDCHSRGLKVLLYFGFLISDMAPEWNDFGKECVVAPKGGYPVYHYLPQPNQSAWRVCLRSVWQDLLVEGIGRVMDEFDVDGVYLDGTEYPFSCINLHHGCGTLKPDGSVTPTYPIFAVRSAMRRIYRAVRSRKQDGQINVHNSTCMTIPTLAWGTSYWDGEQFSFVKPGSSVMETLPLDAFRCEFMGRQWGVPSEFLCDRRGPFKYVKAWSLCLLHDIPVRAMWLKELDLLASIWGVMDEFGRKEAKWLPYWKNSQYITVFPKGVFVSLYHHPKNGVLVVVSNLGKKSTDIQVRLNFDKFNLSLKNTSAYDALSKETVQMENGRFRLKLSTFGWKLIWIR